MSRIACRVLYGGVLAAALLVYSNGRAEILLMPREKLIDAAGYIGVVQVTEIREVQPHPVRGLAKEATVMVQETVKGHVTSSFVIAFDNGLMCPNVSYEQGATYLVFLAPAADGRYVTINHEQGRVTIKNGRIPWWHVDDRVGTLVADALAELRAYLAGQRSDA